MNHTYVGRNYSRKEAIPNFANRYTSVKNEYVRTETQKKFRYQLKYDGVLGHSNIYTSTLDLVKWNKAIREHSVLKKETLDMVYDQINLPSGIKAYNTLYGYGCYINTNDKFGKVIWQAGGDDGGHSYIYRFIDKDKLVVILSNKTHDDDKDTELAPVVFNGKFFAE
jgi:hypothetical protein